VPNAQNISLGPGTLYVAQVGSTEPTDVTTALNAAWKEVGYTAEGSEISIDMSTDPVDVAEEIDPVFSVIGGRTVSVKFAMVENTARNLTIAMNGGTLTTTAGVTKYEPPAPGSATRVALLFQSEDSQERWIFRQCFQSGSVAIGRRKGADKATIPVEMRAEKVTGKTSFTVLFKDSRSGGTI
jgi:hypothetical protein